MTLALRSRGMLLDVCKGEISDYCVLGRGSVEVQQAQLASCPAKRENACACVCMCKARSFQHSPVKVVLGERECMSLYVI